MPDFGFFNMDCMEGMKQYPDQFFDLAIVDPPYGGGLIEGGGCQGWFSKYHQNAENSPNNCSGGGHSTTGSEIPEADLKNTSLVSRTGGTWATKYGKKS